MPILSVVLLIPWGNQLTSCLSETPEGKVWEYHMEMGTCPLVRHVTRAQATSSEAASSFLT